VELGPEDDRSALRYRGSPSVGVGVVRQSKSNLVEVANAVHAALPAIQQALPPGVRIIATFDQSVFVKRSIQEAEETLIIAALLVVAIIFVFLRNFRATIIPAFAIPTSIVSTFAVMYFLGFSINNLTLLALTLAIGVVVDDAIIVLENAFRHQEELHEDPETAAVNGTREIAFAVVATTIALVAVFTPLAFLQGNTGRLFNEFGIAVAGSVLISGFVALTLTPMLCAKILRVPPRHGWLYQRLERGFNGLASGYARSLRWALHHRMLMVGLAGLTALAAVVTFRSLKREFVPAEDRGFFFTMVIAPEGSTLNYTDGYIRQLERFYADVPEIEHYFSITGAFFGTPSRGGVFARLTDWSDRERTVQDIMAEVQPRLFGVPGVMAFAINPPAFGGFGNPVQFVIQHPDFRQLQVAVDTMMKRIAQVPGLVNLDSDLRVNKPELTVSFDRDRAEDLGVPVRDVASALQTMLGGREVSTFTRNNRLYDVIVQLTPETRATPSDMSGIYLRGRDDQLVQLEALASVQEGVGPRQLAHFNRVRSATISAGLAPGFTLGEALDSMHAIAEEVLPVGSTTALAGESRELEESGAALYFAFGLALIVVFMVLASQFESLIHPFTVLLSVPLAVTGALLTLKVADSTINLYSQIGMILLIGLVTKNSILLVEYTNQLKERGLASIDAALEAGRIRLRPILMTSVATVAGALPIALGLGAGSLSRRPLGYAIVGGLVFSTLLTLFIVPAVYVIFDGLVARLRRRAPAGHPPYTPAEAE
jgi:multidrug efflux pump